MDYTRPPIPPRSTKPPGPYSLPVNPLLSKENSVSPLFDHYRWPQAGALYPPGQWPTPELLMYPIGRHTICNNGPFTSETLQSVLDDMGPSSIVYLPPSSKWTINQPIKLHENQELATWGYPVEESQMALLEAGEDCYPFIVNAWAITGAKLRNVVVDGGRQKYSYEPKCGVMLQFGQKAYNQVVDRCILRHPRHWSCVQAFQGSHNVRITNNKIGPAGIGSEIKGGEWADGISFAGSHGLVAGNEIIDATDGAIVVFGAPGTLVISNTIISQNSVTLGGINMVDFADQGNYSGTQVVHNTLIARGPSGYFKTGIGQGPSVWWKQNPPEKVNYGAVVMYNLIDSQAINGQFGSFGYGFPVASNVRDWICVGNVSLGHVPYTGDLTKSLPTPNAPPGAFIYDGNPLTTVFIPSNSYFVNDPDAYRGKVVLQSDFMGQLGRIAALIAIEPGVTRVRSYGPGQFVLNSGQSTHVADITLSFDQDNHIRIRQRRSDGNGLILWEARSRQPGIPEQYLHYSEAGKLSIGSPQGHVDDFTPYIHSNVDGGSFTISSLNPYLTITKPPLHSLLFASAYIFSQNKSFLLGQIVARSYNDRTILYTLSPYCQFVVLRSKRPNAPLPTLPLVWPEKEREHEWDWEVVWHTPKPPTDRRTDASMHFQGDGNLVIYSNKQVPWASGTHGRVPPATILRLGFGTATEPWLELITDEGHRVWSS